MHSKNINIYKMEFKKVFPMSEERTRKFRALQMELTIAAAENDATLLMEKQVAIEWYIDGQISLEIVKANMTVIDASVTKAVELYSTGQEGYKHLTRKHLHWLRTAQAQAFGLMADLDNVAWTKKQLEIEQWVQNTIDEHILGAARFLVTLKAKNKL
jgi:hypothetical protein